MWMRPPELLPAALPLFTVSRSLALCTGCPERPLTLTRNSACRTGLPSMSSVLVVPNLVVGLACAITVSASTVAVGHGGGPPGLHWPAEHMSRKVQAL